MMGGSCPACGVERHLARFRFKKNGYRIVQCARCTCLFVDPPPMPLVLASFYNNREYFESSDGFGYVEYSSTSRLKYGSTWNYRLDEIAARVSTGTLLDLGCATGCFLEMARERGWTIAGVEISEFAADLAEKALGIRVARSLRDVPDASADVVTAWEYVEHLVDPTEELKAVWRVLKPGGWFALSTPNTGNRLAAEDLQAWNELKPPEHLNFFTAETLSLWLSRNRFEEISIQGIVPIGHLHPAWMRRITRALDRLRVGPALRKMTKVHSSPTAKPVPVSTDRAPLPSCLGLLALMRKPQAQ